MTHKILTGKIQHKNFQYTMNRGKFPQLHTKMYKNLTVLILSGQIFSMLKRQEYCFYHSTLFNIVMLVLDTVSRQENNVTFGNE